MSFDHDELMARAAADELIDTADGYPLLVLTVGLPRSGKSTWARLARSGGPGITVVESDAVRKALGVFPFVPEREREVWKQVETTIATLFAARTPVVILDSTSTTKTRRRKWINPAWRLAYKFFPVSAEVCKMRASMDDRADLLPVITRMAAELEPPGFDDGKEVAPDLWLVPFDAHDPYGDARA
jgi:predicted kinase